MAPTSILLNVFLALLMVLAAIELSFISSTVAYLHKAGDKTFAVTYNGKTIDVPGLPENLSVNQGHSSNGAAGTALIVIGWCGILALQRRSRAGYHNKGLGGLFSRSWYRLWLTLNVPALLLTLGSLAYVFAVTNKHKGNTIDLSVVEGLANGDKYPLLEWTPQGWFNALLKLDLVSGSDKRGLKTIHRIATGWQYNLIPFFIIQLGQNVLALLEAQRKRKEDGRFAHGGPEKDLAYSSPGFSNGAK